MAGGGTMTTFPEYVEDYLRLRRALGYKLVEPGRTLPHFAARLEATGTEFVTVDAALAWALEPDVPQGSVVGPMRMLVARGFARYMAGIDPRTEIPPTGLLPFRQRWRAPFIYSDADIMALMSQAHRVIPEPLRAATFETLIGLFTSTGLRIGEAIKLDRSDIDWLEGVLLVRESKFMKSRHVPLHESALQALRRYARQRDALCPNAREASFFVSLRGTRLLRTSVEKVFRELCESSGVGAEAPLPPRVHEYADVFVMPMLGRDAVRAGLMVV